MEATLDRFGRLVIPKKVRDHLGLGPGSVLEIEGGEENIVLRPRRRAPDLVEENGVFVFTGEPDGDIEHALERERELRLADLAV